VPFSVEVSQEQFIEASFEERPTGTVLKIRLKNPFSAEVAPDELIAANFEQGATGTILRIGLKNLNRFVDKDGKVFWAFNNF
jgi:hypothetical protein